MQARNFAISEAAPEMLERGAMLPHPYGMKLRIKELREERGMTQKDLASAVNTTHVSISRIENGGSEALIKLERIAEALGVEVVDLLSDEPRSKALRDIEAIFRALPSDMQDSLVSAAQALQRAVEPR